MKPHQVLRRNAPPWRNISNLASTLYRVVRQAAGGAAFAAGAERPTLARIGPEQALLALIDVGPPGTTTDLCIPVGDPDEIAQKRVRVGLQVAVGAVSSDELVHFVTAGKGMLCKSSVQRSPRGGDR
jgi:hypothetical protein